MQFNFAVRDWSLSLSWRFLSYSKEAGPETGSCAVQAHLDCEAEQELWAAAQGGGVQSKGLPETQLRGMLCKSVQRGVSAAHLGALTWV